MTMKYPKEFNQVILNLSPGFDQWVKSKGDAVKCALTGIDRKDAAVLVPFLTTLLDTHSPQELQQWWWSTPSGIYFHDAETLAGLLRGLQVALSNPPYVEM